jgi:uncharacterized protein YerC
VRAARETTESLALLYRRAREEQELLELRLLICDLLERMTVTQKRIVQLRLDGHQVDDIMQATGSSRRTIERVLQAFRDTMRDELHGET